MLDVPTLHYPPVWSTWQARDEPLHSLNIEFTQQTSIANKSVFLIVLIMIMHLTIITLHDSK